MNSAAKPFEIVTPALRTLQISGVFANLLNACFGGSAEPWTAQFPPNSYTCGYIANGYYVSNWYNGTVTGSTGDVKAYIIDDPEECFAVQASTNGAITSSIGWNGPEKPSRMRSNFTPIW